MLQWHYTSWWETRCFPPGLWTNQGFALTIYSNIILKVSANAVQQEKETQGFYLFNLLRETDWEGSNKTVFVYRSHDGLLRNLCDSQGINKKFLELINGYRKAAGYLIICEQRTVEI